VSNENVEQEIKIKGKIRVVQVRWQKDNFGIMVAAPVEMVHGKDGFSKPLVDKYNTFILKGNCPTLAQGDVYSVIATEVEDEKWGTQYNITFMHKSVDCSTKSSQRAYLSTIITDTQLESLYDALEDPFTSIKEEDVSALVQAKGIGITTAYKLINKYKETIDYSEAFVEFSKIGLSNAMIQKLSDIHGSPNVLVEAFRDNPYILCDISGFGFKKADEYARRAGIEHDSPRRIEAFIKYYLKEQSLQGNSWIMSKQLAMQIRSVLGEIDKNVLRKVVPNMEELWFSEDRTRVGLERVRRLEENICNELLRIHNSENDFNYEGWEAKVEKLQENVGFKYTDEQIAGIKTVLENPITCVTGLGGCVDKDTEFFNGKKWKKISEYEDGDMVLQYHKDGSADLVRPLDYVKKPVTHMNLIKTPRGSVNQCLSDEHNVVYLTSKGNIAKKPFTEINKMHDQNPRGFSGRFITTFSYNNKGLALSEWEIRLMVAIIADGSFPRQTNRCYMNILKPRKIKRLENILQQANIPYEKTLKQNGYSLIKFDAPCKEKEYGAGWYNANQHQLQIIADEVFHWDGSLSNNRNRFFSTSKKSADFIQFCFSAIGQRATLSEYDRVGTKHTDGKYEYQTKEYTVHVAKKNKTVSIQSKYAKDKLDIQKVESVDGFKYCFTVPTNMLVLRREGRIFITGNTGKTTVVKAMLTVLGTYDFAQCALSGKAANRMFQVTGYDGKTIHRLLGTDPKGGFLHNEEDPLPQDIIIIDEASMIGGSLFLSLLKAIASGTKVVILGDAGQLSSIGVANVFHDILKNKTIPTVKLTKIHRQAQKSAIITESINIRKQNQIFDSDFEGTKILGELQDLELDIYQNKELSILKVLNQFKKHIDRVDNILDIQILVAMKERGEICCFKINKAIQQIYNPRGNNPVEIGNFEQTKYVLSEGDKVINTKNNYKAISIEGERTPIFNGNIGIIEKINVNEGLMVINFEGIGRILIPYANYKDISLAYAITTHKSQGDQWHTVIACTDYSAYMSLSCEWLYTAITRAEKYAVLCGENKAIRYGISQSKTPIKQTFLCEMLNG